MDLEPLENDLWRLSDTIKNRSEQTVIKDEGNVTFICITPDVITLEGDILRVKIVPVAIGIAPHFAYLTSGCNVTDIIIGVNREGDS
jgi:hypothetical protein